MPPALTQGPFSIEEAKRAGLSLRQLQGASWRLVGPRTYQFAKLPDSPILSLRAVLSRSATFSGLSAAWLHGLDVDPANPIEITIPGRGRSLTSGVRTHREDLRPGETVRRQGLPTTSPLKTVTDVARRATLTEAVAVTDMALHARLVRLADLQAFVTAHRGAKGVARLRSALKLAEPLTESPMETRLRLLLIGAGLPRPEVQPTLRDQRGHFLARPDLLYPAAKLILEYDGATHRTSLAEDNRRQNRLVDAGYRLLRFTAGDLHTPHRIVAHVETALKNNQT